MGNLYIKNGGLFYKNRKIGIFYTKILQKQEKTVIICGMKVVGIKPRLVLQLKKGAFYEHG